MRLNSRLESAGFASVLLKEGVAEYEAEKKEKKESEDEYRRDLDHYLSELYYFSDQSDIGEQDAEKMFQLVREMHENFSQDEGYVDIAKRAYWAFVANRYHEGYDDEEAAYDHDAARIRTDVSFSLRNFHRLYSITGVPPQNDFDPYSNSGMNEIIRNPSVAIYQRVVGNRGSYIQELNNLVRKYKSEVVGAEELIRDAVGPKVDREKLGKLFLESIENYFAEPFNHSTAFSLSDTALVKRAFNLSLKIDSNLEERIIRRHSQIILQGLEGEDEELVYSPKRGWTNRLEEARDILAVLGKELNFAPSREQVLESFNRVLESIKPDTTIDKVEAALVSIEQATGISREFDAALVSATYTSLLLNKINDFFRSRYGEVSEDKRIELKEILLAQELIVKKLVGQHPPLSRQAATDFYDKLLIKAAADYNLANNWGACAGIAQACIGFEPAFSKEALQTHFLSALKNSLGNLEAGLEKARGMAFGAPIEFNPEEVRGFYHKLLAVKENAYETKRSMEQNLVSIPRVEVITGVPPDFSEASAAVQKLYGFAIKEREFELISKIKEVTGHDLDTAFHKQDIEEAFINCILEWRDPSRRIGELQNVTGLSPEWKPERIQRIFEDLLDSPNDCSSRITEVYNITNISPDWDLLRERLQKCYYRILTDDKVWNKNSSYRETTTPVALPLESSQAQV